MDNKTIASGLLNETMSRQEQLSRLNVPNTNYSKMSLMGGMAARNQRISNKNFMCELERQRKEYGKQREALGRYIEGLDSSDGESLISGQSVQPPVPKTSFWELPKLGRIRR